MARFPDTPAVRVLRLRLCVLLILVPAAGARTQDPLAAILGRLDRLERENRALAQEVRALRARLDGVTAPAAEVATDASEVPGASGATAPVSIEQKLEIQDRRIAEMAESKVEASQRFPVRLTGQALFNVYANSRQSGGSKYPAVASPSSAPSSDGATLRQSIVGLDFRGPVTVWGGHVHGSLYMDFFSGATNNTARLRTASIEISWKSRSFMAGLEKPVFNPREPASLAQVGISPMTGAGNLWLWLPQVRFQQDLAVGFSSGLRAQVGVLQTRETGPYPGSVFTGGVEAARPALEGRLEFFHRFDDERRFEIAPGFHVSQSHAGGFSVPSRIFSLDWFFNPWRRAELTGAFYRGRNVAPLGAGYNQGFGVYYGRAEAVESTGGWAQLTLRLLPRLDLHLASGQQDDQNYDLLAGRIGKNLQFGANLFIRLAPNVILGPEISQVRTVYIGQGVRINNHYDLALAYLF